MKQLVSGLFLISAAMWACLSIAYLGFGQARAVAEILAQMRPEEGFSAGGMRVLGWGMGLLAGLHVRRAFVSSRLLTLLITLLAMAWGLFPVNTLILADMLHVDAPQILYAQVAASIVSLGAITVEWWADFFRKTSLTTDQDR